MTIRNMRIFLEVYRTQNITKAAAALHMTQPAVTRAVQEMESYYGVRLFDRINRRLYVTEAGHHLYSQALHVVDVFDGMEQSLRNWDAMGVLRIGSSITLGNFLLPDLILQFGQTHPGLKVQVTISNGASLKSALLNNELDLALLECGADHANLVSLPLMTDQMVLILPHNHPLADKEQVLVADLVHCDLLLRERDSAARSFLDSVFAVHGLTLHPLWESASTQALVKAVSKGIGVSLLPRMLVKHDIDSGAVVTRPIANEALERKNEIAWHKNKYLTSAAKDFIDLCQSMASSPI